MDKYINKVSSNSCVLIDQSLIIREIHNINPLLFSCSTPKIGSHICDQIAPNFSQQIEEISKGIQRSFSQKRNTCFEYLSDADTYVCAFVEYLSEEFVRLYLRSSQSDDLSYHQQQKTKNKQSIMLQTIYDNLSVGVEVYNSKGRLIDLNPQALRELGLEKKEDVLGVCFFDNPNLPEDIKAPLLAGESKHFFVDYDFDALQGWVDTSKKGIARMEANISVVRNEAGIIENYIIISRDLSEYYDLQKKYEQLYNQNSTLLESLPSGVGVYSPNGDLLYSNKACASIFGSDDNSPNSGKLNLNNSLSIPDEVKNAVKEGTPINTHFPYSFDMISQTERYSSNRSGYIHLECSGLPVLNKSAKMEYYVFIFNDITEKIKNEELLRQSNHKTELALKAADIMFWEFDVNADHFISDNEPLNGYNRAKTISSALYIETAHPEDKKLVTDVMERMNKGEDFTFDFEFRARLYQNESWQYCSVNGAPYERDQNGVVTKYVGTRKNNTELHKKKIQQEKILNSIPFPIHIKDVEENFRYVFCNEESKRMFGTSEDKTTYDVMSDEAVERIRKTDFEVFNTGEPYLGLERIELKDGRVYNTIVNKSLIKDGNKRLVMNVRWDQSLQNELKRQAKLLSVTMETMNAYTWFYEPDRERISFGDGFDKIGRKSSEIDSLDKFLECVHPDDRAAFLLSLSSTIDKINDMWTIECRIDFNGDGKYSWWEARGLLEEIIINDIPTKYMFGMTICIDSHKKIEETLVENKEELRRLLMQNELVLNNTNSGLAYISSDHIVQWENISKCSTSLSFEAYKKGELCYKSAHNRDTPCEDCVLQRSLLSGQMEKITFELQNKNTIEVFATPVFGVDKSIEGIVIRVDDITQRQRMIRELEQAKAQAVQSDKLKSAFLANMSHEIRTPLNAIVGFSELLTDADDQEKKEYVSIIKNNNDLLLRLISDILDLSKIEAGSVELKYEDFDLSDLFDGMVTSMQQRMTNPNVRLVSQNPFSECHIHLDKNRLTQIMTNYVTNAIKYTPKGFIEMGYDQVDSGIRMYVKDSGIGISDSKKPKVFHRFAKLDEFAQGTGLGLSICKALAESMGGEVGFESEFGQGSMFWVIFPCNPLIKDSLGNVHNSQKLSENNFSQSLSSDQNSRKTILVAEDMPSNYLLISAILKENYNLIHAENGQIAVDIAKSTHIDLILMDMKMPVKDGLLSTLEIRTFDTELPIIALTAHAFETDKVAAFEAGCNDYLVKPIDRAKLIEVVRKYC